MRNVTKCEQSVAAEVARLYGGFITDYTLLWPGLVFCCAGMKRLAPLLGIVRLAFTVCVMVTAHIIASVELKLDCQSAPNGYGVERVSPQVPGLSL